LTKATAGFRGRPSLWIGDKRGFEGPLFRRSPPLAGIGLSRQLLGLLIDHFPRDQAVFKGCIAIHEAAALRFQLRGALFGRFSRFQEFFQTVVHVLYL
jgi:hypothetical protein